MDTTSHLPPDSQDNETMNEWIGQSATDCVALLQKREVSSRELVESAAERIEAVNPAVNALPLLCLDRAIKQAELTDLARGRNQTVGLLQGLPIAVKDYNDVGGVITTYGSPLFSTQKAERSDATVQHLEQNGAIPIGKSNVPEWAGGHTFNPVYGTTSNPWKLSRSAGGSSGGSAAALATGMVWLATGNDLGGSLRTPSAFNGIVGFRPGPGIVPRGQRLLPFDTLWVEGPMARSVDDVALMLDAGAGHHPEDPLSQPVITGGYRQAMAELAKPVRVAFSTDLGVVPMAQEIADVCANAVQRYSREGIEITDSIPDFQGVLAAFQTLRGVLLGTMMGDLLAQHRDKIAPEIVGNIELGLQVTVDDIFKAEKIRWNLQQQVHEFFKHHDVLICPTSSIAAFPAEQRYVTEIDGQPLDTYIDWFAITFALTMTACPVVSVPCGKTADGLPIGLQLMGRPRGEAQLLRAAKLFEDVMDLQQELPIDPRV